ncbi:MAG: hypothetical protein ACI84D_003829, partial [Thalassolituus oleivorans]
MRHLLLTMYLVASAALWMRQDVAAQVAEQDSLALVALFNATVGPGWDDYGDRWMVGPVGTWRGVQIRAGRVTGLIVERAGMRGVLPPELANLTELERLSLVNNRIGGEIGPW